MKNCPHAQQVLPDFLCPPFPSPSPGDRWYLSVAMESDADREITHAGISRCHAPQVRPGFTHAKQRRVPLPNLQKKQPMQWNWSRVIKVCLTSSAVKMVDILASYRLKQYQAAAHQCFIKMLIFQTLTHDMLLWYLIWKHRPLQTFCNFIRHLEDQVFSKF